MKFKLLILIAFMFTLSSITYILNRYDESFSNTQNFSKDLYNDVDSSGISKKIMSCFDFKWIELKNIVKIDLDTNKNTNEYLVEYMANSEDSKFWDVYLVLENGYISNLYHEKKLYEDPDFSVISINNMPFLMKTISSGSGSFLNCEIFKYDGLKNLSKVFQIPSDISTFQGEYYIKNNEVFFSLASKKYKLALNQGIPELFPYTNRLKITDFSGDKHLLTIDSQNDDLVVFFDDKKIDFIKEGETLESRDTIKYNLNDTIWIDDNSLIPASVRFFEFDGFQFNDDLFPNFLFTKDGYQTFEFVHAYNGRYILNFNIIK